jgi:Family of unknown function (DUF6491)
MRSIVGALAVSAVLFGYQSAVADTAPPPPPGTPPQCFFVRNFQSWKAPDVKTIYIRVNVNQFYRLDLASSCSGLRYPGAHLITEWRGSSSVCQGIDWDLRVAQSYPSGRQACIVKTQTPLTPAEAAAIPRKFRP